MKQIVTGYAFLFSSLLFAGESHISQISVPEKTWTGLYFGGSVGGIWSNSPGQVADEPFFDHDGRFFPSFAQPWNTHQSSFAGGAQLGSLYQSGHLVYGTEISILGMNLEDSHTFTVDEIRRDFINIFKAGDSFSSQIQWQASWVARLGYAANDWLLYGTGGVAFIKPKVSASISPIVIDGDLFPATQGSDEKTLTGGTVGIGAEYAPWSNLSIGMEYRYADFGTHHFAVGNNPVSTLPNGFIYTGMTAEKKFTTNLVMLRLNYHMNL